MDKGSNIEKAKQKALDELKKHIDEMGTAAYAIMLKAIEDTFDFKQGKIQGDKDFIEQLNKLTVDVLDLLQSEPKFTGPVSQFVKRMPAISDAITSFQKSTNGIKVPAFEVAKKIVIDEIIDKMLGNGLNYHFVIPLRELIYQNVIGELSLSDAKQAIREFITGTKVGKYIEQESHLSRYLQQTAQQAVDSYAGLINLKILENFQMDGLLITGSLIDNSSPQCRFAINELGGKITRDNWPEVVAHATKRFPLIEGTTFDNLPLNRLHWGCRHSFYPFLTLKKAA